MKKIIFLWVLPLLLTSLLKASESKTEDSQKDTGSEHLSNSLDNLFKKKTTTSSEKKEKSSLDQLTEAYKQKRTGYSSSSVSSGLKRAKKQTEIGMEFAKGLNGRPYDLSQAKAWFLKAANSRHAPAMFQLSQINSSDDERRRWLFSAADAGSGEAMQAIAAAYLNGVGGYQLQKNSQSALEWARRAKQVNPEKYSRIFTRAEDHIAEEKRQRLLREQSERNQISAEKRRREEALEYKLEKLENDRRAEIKAQKKASRRARANREAEEAADRRAQGWNDIVNHIQDVGDDITSTQRQVMRDTQRAYQHDKRVQRRNEQRAKEEYERKKRKIEEEARRNRERGEKLQRQKELAHQQREQREAEARRRAQQSQQASTVPYAQQQTAPAVERLARQADPHLSQSPGSEPSSTKAKYSKLKFVLDTSPNKSHEVHDELRKQKNENSKKEKKDLNNGFTKKSYNSRTPNPLAKATIGKKSAVTGTPLSNTPVAGGWTNLTVAREKKEIAESQSGMQWWGYLPVSSVAAIARCEKSGEKNSSWKFVIKNDYNTTVTVQVELTIQSSSLNGNIPVWIATLKPGEERTVASRYIKDLTCMDASLMMMRITSMKFREDKGKYASPTR